LVCVVPQASGAWRARTQSLHSRPLLP